MKGIRTWMGAAVMAALFVSPGLLLATKGPKPLAEQVRHELVMLPYYGVFDNLMYQVNGDTVTLMGDVTRPILKSDAENVVRRIPGVKSVDNQINVLPLSSFDDHIRWRELRAIYGNSVLSRYGLGVHPSIRIIVNRGDVRLEGTVMNEADRNIAGLMANGVSGAFSVTNNLVVKKS